MFFEEIVSSDAGIAMVTGRLRGSRVRYRRQQVTRRVTRRADR